MAEDELDAVSVSSSPRCIAPVRPSPVADKVTSLQQFSKLLEAKLNDAIHNTNELTLRGKDLELLKELLGIAEKPAQKRGSTLRRTLFDTKTDQLVARGKNPRGNREIIDADTSKYFQDNYVSNTDIYGECESDDRMDARKAFVSNLDDQMAVLRKNREQANEQKITPFHEDIRIGCTQEVFTGAVATQLVEQLTTWSFDIFGLAANTSSPLFCLGHACLEQFSLSTKLDLDESKLRNFIVAVEASYLDQRYHNRLHGADVTHSVFYFLSTGGMAAKIPDPAVLGMLVAAMCHDAAHPGLNNKFLKATQHELAVKYNDQSPLEMMHASTCFEILREDVNYFTESMTQQAQVFFREVCEGVRIATTEIVGGGE